MKLIKHEVERVRDDRLIVKSLWADRFRNPATVKVTTDKTPVQALESTLDCDPKDAFEIMSGFAEIAWGMGWRPAGLGPTLDAVVKNFKLPSKA